MLARGLFFIASSSLRGSISFLQRPFARYVNLDCFPKCLNSTWLPCIFNVFHFLLLPVMRERICLFFPFPGPSYGIPHLLSYEELVWSRDSFVDLFFDRSVFWLSAAMFCLAAGLSCIRHKQPALVRMITIYKLLLFPLLSLSSMRL